MGSEGRGGIDRNSMMPDVNPLFWRRLLEQKDMDNDNVDLSQVEGKKDETLVVQKKGKQESSATEETEEESNEMDSELMLPDENDDQNPEIKEGEKNTLEIDQQVVTETKTTFADKELKKTEQEKPSKKRNPESSKMDSELGREGEVETKAKGKQDENKSVKNLQSKAEKKPVTEQAADQNVVKEERTDSEMVKLQQEGITNEERQKDGKEREKTNTEKGVLQDSSGEMLEESDEVQQKTDSKSQLTKEGADSVIKLQKDEILSGKGKKEKKRKSKRKTEAVDGQGSAGERLGTLEQISEDRSGKKMQLKTVSESQYEESSVESEVEVSKDTTMTDVNLKAKKRGKKISDLDSESETESEVEGEAEEKLALDLKETQKNTEKEGTKVLQKKKEKPHRKKRGEEKSKMVMDDEVEVKKSKSDDKISGLVTKEATKAEQSLDSAESELLVEAENRNRKAEKKSKNKAEETPDSTKATQKKTNKEKPLKQTKREEELKVKTEVVDEDIEGDDSESDGTTSDLAAKAKKGEEKLGNKAEKKLDVTSQRAKKQKGSDKETKEKSPLKETRVEEESEVELLKEPESDGTADVVRTAKKGEKKSDSESKSGGGDKVEQKSQNKAEKSLDAASQNGGKQNTPKEMKEKKVSEGKLEAMDEKTPEETQNANEQKVELISDVLSQASDEGKGMKESKKNVSKDAQQSGIQESDDDDDEYGEFMQDFINLPSKFQDTAQRVAGHLRPNIQKITDRSKVYLNKANQHITESFSPLVGKQYAPFLASVISYGLLLLPLAVVIILFENIRALLSLQKVLLFANIYLAAYFAILLLATFIIGSEPMTFFYKNATNSYIHMQLLQALGYIVYLILQTCDVVSSCSSESVAAKVTVVVQWFVAFMVGFHYYVTVFHRAMAMKLPHTSWKIYGIYSFAFSILCLFARIKRTKKEYVQVGQVDSNKKN